MATKWLSLGRLLWCCPRRRPAGPLLQAAEPAAADAELEIDGVV
jgi:hypothetical protein